MKDKNDHDNKTYLLSLIAEQLYDALAITNLDYEITYTNKAFHEIYGYSRDELLGQTPGILNSEPNSEQIQNDIYKTVSSGKVWRSEAINRKKDGSTFRCELVIFPLVDKEGKIFAYAGSQRDITKRKHIEEELMERVEELEAFYQMAVGRELKMKELKEEIEILKSELAKYKP